MSRAAAVRIAVAVASLAACTSADGCVDLDGRTDGHRRPWKLPARWPLHETYALVSPPSLVRYRPRRRLWTTAPIPIPIAAQPIPQCRGHPQQPLSVGRPLCGRPRRVNMHAAELLHALPSVPSIVASAQASPLPRIEGTGVNGTMARRYTCQHRCHAHCPLHLRRRPRRLGRTECNRRPCKWHLPCSLALRRASTHHCHLHRSRNVANDACGPPLQVPIPIRRRTHPLSDVRAQQPPPNSPPPRSLAEFFVSEVLPPPPLPP